MEDYLIINLFLRTENGRIFYFLLKSLTIEIGIITQYPITRMRGEIFVDKKLVVSPAYIRIYPNIIVRIPTKKRI